MDFYFIFELFAFYAEKKSEALFKSTLSLLAQLHSCVCVYCIEYVKRCQACNYGYRTLSS